jgi:hypothetical protein
VLELQQKASEAIGLCEEQKQSLFDLLLLYKYHFTSKPGQCTLLNYKFQVTDETAIVSASRPILFSVRDEVRMQIRQLLDDGIIEPSNSCYVNPLTIVIRPGKASRICLDARRVNRHMTPDHTRTAPIHELLQRFHGAKYISCIDLSSAFLQVQEVHCFPV